MISERYKYKSEELFKRFVSKAIDYKEYQEEREKILEEEINRIKSAYPSERRKLREALYSYESLHHLAQLDREIKTKNLSEQEKYYEFDIPEIIQEYQDKSKRNRNIHNLFQWIIIIGSVIVTSTTGATIITETFGITVVFKWIAAVSSILVSIAAGATGYYKFRERSANLQETADDIEQEYKALKLRIGIYKDAWNKSKEEALSIFAETVERRIKEQKQRQRILEEPPDTKHGQVQIQH